MNRQQERRRWYGMLHRCENPRHHSYRYYGGRGIKVCERWHDFGNYYADIMRLIGPCPDSRMSLDRIDNDGDYEPGNVRWATAWQQSRNSRVYGNSRRRPPIEPTVKLRISRVGAWLVPAEAAAILGMDEAAVTGLIHTERLRAVELSGKYLIDEHALAEYMHGEGLEWEVRGRRHLNQLLALRYGMQPRRRPGLNL